MAIFYQVSTTFSTSGTFLLPPVAAPNAAFTFSLPGLATTKSSPPTVSNSDFNLAIASGPLVQVTLQSTVWSDQRPARMANFTSFLADVETQLELAGWLVPGATYRIAQWIADFMPAPLTETLFYRYSFSPGFAAGTLPFVDLCPGMRVDVQGQASQYLGPSSPQNGYVANGHWSFGVHTVLNPDGSHGIGFNPFLATMKMPSVTLGASPPLMAGGLIDLESVSGARTHWRLFYPPTLPAPSQPGQGGIGQSVTLVGAATLVQLNEFSTPSQYPNPTTDGAVPNIYITFSGRPTIVPMISILITAAARGQTAPPAVVATEFVPVGTTLANVFERFCRMITTDASAVSLWRRTPGTGTPPTSTTIGVQLSPGNNPLPAAAFDLPLIAGDIVSLGL